MKHKNVHHLFKAFADSNRLRILHILSHGERCVCDIMAVLKMGQSKVSRHLAYLKRIGLVQGRKEGLWVHYSMVPPENELHKQLLDCLGSCLDVSPLFQQDIVLLKQISKKRESIRKQALCC